MRLILSITIIFALASTAAAQDYSTPKPRRQWVTISIDWMRTEALHFAEHPLEDLVGQQVNEVHNQPHDYETRDGRVLIDVLQFRKRNTGFSAAVYPFGLSVGVALGVRASVETMPTIRINFSGEGAPPAYALTGANAYDLGVGLFVADRSAGWGLGAQAFVVGGVGRIKADAGRDGKRTFAEGGGGLIIGPFGVQIAVKFAWNRLDDPVEHRFFTIPVTLRGTLSF
jgi:hypothetical protein